ncbi:MAG: UDP-glucose 4-epimerase GalE [Bacteroidetes bacterium]|nr:UDP-glucose 4-epimerase GalE [Bacteroidota bacterium]
MAKILVTGGAGYIGSHTIVDLINNGYEVISIDNYARSNEDVFLGIKAICDKQIVNYQVDICNLLALEKVFTNEKEIVGVIHFAAYKSVNESVLQPILYYENNIYGLLNILKCIEKFDIPYFVFSSSCSVYGNIDSLPVSENTPLSKPESPYAATKQMGEQMIHDFAKTTSANSVMLRYFNPVGAHPSALIGEVPFGKPANLVPAITQTAIGWQEKLLIWGNDYNTRDGSCIRDYIHVMDIAHAHTLALFYLLKNKNASNCEIFNVGSGNGVSVLEAIHAFEKVSEAKLNYEVGPRREGDVVSIYASNENICKKLNWKPQFDLDEMMRSAWQWQLALQAKK